MPSFTVLTVSRRTGWEDRASRCLVEQVAIGQRLDWLTISEPGPEPMSSIYKSSDLGVMLFKEVVRAPTATRKSNLNASLNAGLKYITTDYVIFYQDFIDLQPDCFKKLLALATPDTFVTTATINADGKHDARYLGLDCPHPCKPEEWEANVAIAPMSVIRELGGFDEEYDDGWSWDNVNLAERAAILGCKFIIDETNCPRLLPHDKSDIKELNGEFHAQRMREIRAGDRPLRLDYLSV
jgi:hypothetical protein